jgi:hypothetical protein
VAETLRYLASPYTAYKGGMEQAFIDVAILAGRLFAIGIPTFSPIAHAFPYVKYGNLDPLDYPAWKPVQERLMDACDSLIVAHMDGWEKSVGIAYEIAYFERSGKDIFDLNCESLVMTKRENHKHFDERMQLGIADMRSYRGTLGPPLAVPDTKGQ